MTQSTDADQRNTTYSIGAVADLTGLSVHTIRIWERRYQAVVAHRSANGRRVYTPSDVEKLRLLKGLTDRNLPISSIANLSVEGLRERSTDLEKLRAIQPVAKVAVGVFGDFLPERLRVGEQDLQVMDIKLADSSLDRFRADLRHQKLGALVLEMPIVNTETLNLIRSMQESCGAERCVVVFGFGRQEDVEQLRNEGVRTMRTPVTLDELDQAVARPISKAAKLKVVAEPGVEDDTDWDIPVESLGAPAPRRLSREQLQALAQSSPELICECPKQLVDLVNDLTAFEIYSSECQSRSPEDAQLHAYLHVTTANVRAAMEEALERVARYEGLM